MGGRARARAAALAGALAALAASCSIAPRHRVELGADTVRADDPALARAVAERVTLGRERLGARLPDLAETGVEVWVQDEVRLEEPVELAVHPSALTLHFPDRRPRIHVSPRQYRDTLQHELVHALLGPGWGTLPLSAEEGLCTLLNDELADEDAWMIAHVRCAARAGSSSTCSLSVRARPPGGEERDFSSFWGHSGGSDASDSRLGLEEIFRISSARELAELTPPEVGHFYGVGYLVVRRIAAARGLEGLHALCRRAADEGRERVPPAWLLEAAGIADVEQLEALARETLLAEQIRAALTDEHFLDVLRQAVRAALPEPEAGPETFLTRFEGRMVFQDETVDLPSLPAFRAWLREHWSELRAPADEAAAGGS